MLVLSFIAIAGVTAAYAASTGFGFRYDDYGVVRPWTRSEVLGVLNHTWDPTDIEPRFYRPLAAWWYALRFSLFGLNATAQHAISLAGMTIGSILAGLFVWRETRRTYASAMATLLYAIYPAFVYSQAVWLTNQMHLFASVVVLIALLVWQRAHRLGGAAWWWLLVLQAIGFGFKEDTIMLLPLLLALTLLRRWTLRDARLPPLAVLGCAALLLAALPYWRYVALGKHLGGYGMPDAERGWANLSRGLDAFLQRPARRPWQAFAGRYSVACLLLGALAAVLRRNRSSLYLIGCGALIAACFNLPFYLVAKAEQYHLVGLGCVIILAGSLDGLQSAWRSRPLRQSVGAVAAAASLCFLPVTRDIVRDFEPCSAGTLYTDDLVSGWWVVPYEIKEWLRQKPAACKAGQAPPALTEALTTVTWALGREIDETGVPVHWTKDHAVVLFPPSVSRAEVTVRSPVASKELPTTVMLRSGAAEARIVLTDGRWTTQTIKFKNSLWTTLSGSRRLDIEVSPVFIPDERFHNGDKRVLGVLMRSPETR